MSQPCLPVPDMSKRKKGKGEKTIQFEDMMDITAMSASDYLAAVSEQAKSMPDFFESSSKEGGKETKRQKREAPIDGSAASLHYLISSRASITPLPSNDYLPNDEVVWIDTTLKNFESLRQYLKECKKQGVGGKLTRRWPVPSMKDRPGWHIFCVGRNEARGNAGDYFGDDDDEDDNKNATNNKNDAGGGIPQPKWMVDLPVNGHVPAVALLLQLDTVLNRRVLTHISYFVQEGWNASRQQRAMWLYSLLARLEKPIHRDDAATLYGLLKALTLQRSKLKLGAANGRKQLAMINTLIVIVGLYFGQSHRDSIMKRI
mmetsp:Transcript_12765/g.37111  ORF Transcript_12765/g.37111 Transcript_12765/m.37111 type:complete len:316 (-) Transcript_12765:712-1659(-)